MKVPADPASTAPNLRPWTAEQSTLRPGGSKITAIVLTLNEVDNIARCVSSLGWCDQVLVVDSGSTDDTTTLAEAAGATVVVNAFTGFSEQRMFAMNHPLVQNEWVFFVDADEWVSVDLAEEISERIRNPLVDAYSLRRRLVFQGRWIRFAGWYRASRITRVAKSAASRWEGDVSEKLIVDGTVELLANDLVDEDLKGLSAWLDRHNTYSSLKAAQRAALKSTPAAQRWSRILSSSPRARIPREFAKQLIAPSVPAPGLARFVDMYILRGGFLMGRVGLRFCLLHAMQEMHIRMKMEEAQRALLVDSEPSPKQL